MGLITKEVEVKPCGKFIKYYKEKGYDFNRGDTITVNVNDLPKYSKITVECLCDYCNKNIKEMSYAKYSEIMSDIVKKTACEECSILRRKEKCLIKYGVEHHMQLDSVKEKQKSVMREKYGVDYPMQSKEIIDKSRKSCLKKYGVDNPLKNKEIRNRMAETCTQKYGVPNPFQSEEIKEKIRKKNIQKYGVENPRQSKEVQERIFATNLERYGFKYAIQSPDVRQKIADTYYTNQTQKASNQQRYIANLYKMELNYAILYWTVDMYEKDNNLCVEYDGKGHQLSVELGQETLKDFEEKELIREKSLRQEEYKIIRIISRQDLIPSDKILLQMLKDAKQYFKDFPEHTWVFFDIDNQIIRNAENKDGVPYFYGELRKITKEDLKSA